MEQEPSNSKSAWHPAHRPDTAGAQQPNLVPHITDGPFSDANGLPTSDKRFNARTTPSNALHGSTLPPSKAASARTMDADEDFARVADSNATEEVGEVDSTRTSAVASLEASQPRVDLPPVTGSGVDPSLSPRPEQARWTAKEEEEEIAPTISPFADITTLDRSNSFPDIPGSHSSQQPSHSLPHSQARKILEEEDTDESMIEDEEVLFPQYTQEDEAPSQDIDQGSDFFSQKHQSGIDGSVIPSNDELRFDEGLPLLPNDSAIPESFSMGYNHTGETEEVQESNGNGSRPEQALSDPVQEDVHPIRRRLDRKTTGDVLGSMTFATSDAVDPEPDFGDLLESKAPTSQIVSQGDRHQDSMPRQAEALDAAWLAALKDDDLLDDNTSVDPSSFFGDDAAEFLSEDPLGHPTGDLRDTRPVAAELSSGSSVQHGSISSVHPAISSPSYQPYAPLERQQYASTGTLYQPTLGQGNESDAQPIQPVPLSDLAPPRPQMQRSAQSFADKSKGGYTSPYDLPMDVARPPKKRNFTQQGRPPAGSWNAAGSRAPPPPRSSSMHANSSPTLQSPPSLPILRGPDTDMTQSHPAVKPKPSGFFEELPSAKPRPISKRGLPTHASVPPVEPSVPPGATEGPTAAYRPTSGSSDELQPFGLMPPSRVGPYGNATNHPTSAVVPTPLNSRYSPAPVPQQGVPPPRTRYAASPASVPKGPPPPVIPFQPRTSSPLAQNIPSYQNDREATFEYSPPIYQASTPASNITSPPRNMVRTAALEEKRPLPGQQPPRLKSQSQDLLSNFDRPQAEQPLHYTHNEGLAHDVRHTGEYSQAETRQVPVENHFAPPPRSQTQSPGAVRPRGSLAALSQESVQRPASVNARPSIAQRTTFNTVANPHVSSSASQRSHAPHIPDETNFVKPNDDLQYDSLERWKGCPIFHFGFGGTVVSSLPLRIPRYSAGLMTPSILCSTGDITIQTQNDLLPDDLLATFPGPLKPKSKKKDLLEWLHKKIPQVENQSVVSPSTASTAINHNRSEEKVLLWKLVRILVEHDGVIEGKAVAEKAVGFILSPELAQEGEATDSSSNDFFIGISSRSDAPPLSVSADPGAMEALRKLLLQGERKQAVYYALDRRLWAHAMLISSTMENSVWKQVLQEFVRQEVKTTGQNTESLAALYQMFAGNWDESVDELVPPSARAGMQLVSKVTGPGPTRNALDGLDRWRETVTLALGNPVPGNGQAMAALGRLLASYGRIEASHICYLLAKDPSLFGPPEDPSVVISLLGTSHTEHPLDNNRDIDSIMLTEVLDFAHNVLRSGPVASSLHMQPQKLYHAYILAERGYKVQSQAYCDDLASFIRSTSKAQAPFLSQVTGPLDDLSSRLRQAPNSSSGSWMPKPTMDKVSGSIMSRFTSFVAGEDSDADSAGSGKGQAPDPFAKVAGETPGVSPSPSSGDLYNAYSSGGSYVPVPQPTTAAGSRYAPPSIVTPRSSLDQGGRPTQESPKAVSNDIRKPSLYQQSNTSRYAVPSPSSQIAEEPNRSSSQFAPFQHLTGADASYLPTPPLQPEQMSPIAAPYAQSSGQQASSAYSPQPAPQHYQSSQDDIPGLGDQHRDLASRVPPTESLELPPESVGEVPSYSGYEPPTSGYVPYSPPALTSPPASPRKKKSFMDLSDDEDLSGRKAATANQSSDAAAKAQRDRDADAAFRAAAEADAKKDQALQPKKSGWLGGWFGGGKGGDLGGSGGGGTGQSGAPGAAIKAKLGEESSFYYDKELKKWVNKKAGADAAKPSAPTPPPPRGGPPPGSRAVSGASGLPPRASTDTPPVPPLPAGTPINNSSAPPSTGTLAAPFAPLSNPASRSQSPAVGETASSPPLLAPSNSLMPGGNGPPGGPPSRPGTAISTTSSIDDLLAGPPPGARPGGTMRKKKARGYVDVMAK